MRLCESCGAHLHLIITIPAHVTLIPSHSAYNVLYCSLSCIFWFSSEPLCKSSDVVNAVAKLSKAKHLLDVEDLPG